MFLEMGLIEVPSGSNSRSTHQDAAFLAHMPDTRLIGTPHLLFRLAKTIPGLEG